MAGNGSHKFKDTENDNAGAWVAQVQTACTDIIMNSMKEENDKVLVGGNSGMWLFVR